MRQRTVADCSSTTGSFGDQHVELLIPAHNLETPVRSHKLFLEQNMLDAFAPAEGMRNKGEEATDLFADCADEALCAEIIGISPNEAVRRRKTFHATVYN